ncbi:hypothetical protein ACOMOD_002392 [Enterococcus faecalis]
MKENIFMTGAARQKNVSVSFAHCILRRFHQTLNPFKRTLPMVLYFDEVKSIRQVSGAMSFIILNGQTRKSFDIVKNRQLPYLERYFHHFHIVQHIGRTFRNHRITWTNHLLKSSSLA